MKYPWDAFSSPVKPHRILNKTKSIISLIKMPFSIDTGKIGLEMFFKPYQVEALRVLQFRGEEGANSRIVWNTVNETLSSPISRASIINSLNMMVDEEVLSYTERTGKGGYHRVYKLDMSWSELKEYLARMVICKLMVEYPEETKRVASKL